MGFFTSRQYATSRLLLALAFYVVCNVIVFKYKSAKLPKQNTKSNSTKFDSTKVTSHQKPSSETIHPILFWNDFFKAEDYRFGIGHQPFIDHGCPVTSCRTTTNRDELSQAKAVVFHGPRIEAFPPEHRPPGQIYVYVQEKPNYNPSVSYMSNFNGYMNLTMTNRLDSDIEFPHARIIRNREQTKVEGRRRRRQVDPSYRPRSVAWVVHRCSTPSRREWYVKELRKHIDVDVYGECGEKKCKEVDGEEDQECLSFFQEKYRFYLALEYDVCRDYVSEKIYKAFKKQIVPIVFGGANYSQVVPPGSVIDIKDFSHPRDLADYLKKLSEDPSAYGSYLQWKSTGYDIETSRETILAQNFCKLCEILHDDNYKYRDYSDLKGWWLDGICDASPIPRMRRKADW